MGTRDEEDDQWERKSYWVVVGNRAFHVVAKGPLDARIKVQALHQRPPAVVCGMDDDHAPAPWKGGA